MYTYKTYNVCSKEIPFNITNGRERHQNYCDYVSGTQM